MTFQWNVKAPNYRINDAGKLVYNGLSDQNIRFHGESINPHYIMCTAHPDADSRCRSYWGMNMDSAFPVARYVPVCKKLPNK